MMKEKRYLLRMGRGIFVVLLGSLLVFSCTKKPTGPNNPLYGKIEWVKTYNSGAVGYSVQQTSDGGYIVTGYKSSAEQIDIYLLKTDANGNEQWTKIYGGEGSDYGWSAQQTTDGGYIIVGYTHSFGVGGKAPIYLIKTDENGDTLWTKSFGDLDIVNYGYSIQQTSDDGYIITGKTTPFGIGESDVYLIKTDVQGDTLWTKRYGGTDDDGGFSVQQTSDGGYIIAGWTDSFGAGNKDVYLIKTDTQGKTLWTKTYGGTEYDKGESVKQTSDGGYIVAGATSSFGADGLNVYLIKTDTQGKTLWTKTYGEKYNNQGHSVQETSNGGYVVAGSTYLVDYGYGWEDLIYLVRTDANGELLWRRAYEDMGYGIAYSVQETSDGGYIITGYISTAGVYLLKIEP